MITSVNKVLKRNEPTPKGSKVLWNYAKERIIKKNIERGYII